jgi:uncharacterized protein DUF3748/WD40 repeat protein
MYPKERSLPRMLTVCVVAVAAAFAQPNSEISAMDATNSQRQLTSNPAGHVLTNAGVWSHDSRYIIYDVRIQDHIFDGTRIERVNVETGEIDVLYESKDGACCGVVTCSPVDGRVVFIHGPEAPTPDWQYTFYHRRGVIVDAAQPGVGKNLDARDITSPGKPGALRGGSHVHTFSGDGQWVSFTYEDHVLAALEDSSIEHEPNQRNVGVSVPVRPVRVNRSHPRNHDGEFFTVMASRTVPDPKPGSDEISRAVSDAWIGLDGYVKRDGRRQRRAIAFQGHVVTEAGETIPEVFVVDLPDDVTVASDDGPLQGTATTSPRPPKGTVQRRLTYTADRKYPGLQGTRHWLRSSPDGSRIAFLLKDDDDVAQLWTVSPNGGKPVQVTRNPYEIASPYTWSPDGRWIAHTMDNSVCVTEVSTGKTDRLTPRSSDEQAPTSHACVFSPDGKKIAFMRPVLHESGKTFDQVFVIDFTRP